MEKNPRPLTQGEGKTDGEARGIVEDFGVITRGQVSPEALKKLPVVTVATNAQMVLG